MTKWKKKTREIEFEIERERERDFLKQANLTVWCHTSNDMIVHLNRHQSDATVIDDKYEPQIYIDITWSIQPISYRFFPTATIQPKSSKHGQLYLW